MKGLSIGKAAALASTALLMGAYVWHQARQGSPEAIGDSTTAQPEAGQVQFTTIPGIPVNPDQAIQNIQTAQGREMFPGSKSAMVFPGSKSDTIPLPLPGSKSGTVILPVPGPDNNLPPTKPSVLPGSKSLPMILDEESLKRITGESGDNGGAAEPVLPGSKVKVPIIPPRQTPAPATGEQSGEGEADDQPAGESAEQ